MQEYDDGTYGEIKEGGKLLRELADDIPELARTKAIHFGSVEELEAQKLTGTNAKQLKAKLDQLERKVNRIICHLGIATPGEILVID